MNWIEEHIKTLTLNEECQSYLYGRGLTDEQIEEQRIVSWAPNPHFGDQIKGFGKSGESIEGWVIHPFMTFRQEIFGFEARNVHKKQFVKLVLPDYGWSPLCLGNTQSMLQKLWDGADLYLVEGIYDLSALSWAIESSVVLATVTARMPFTLAQYLARMCKGHIYLVYDNDAPGQRGADKAIRMFSDLGFNRVSKVNYGLKDPGEAWNQGGSEKIITMFGGRL